MARYKDACICLGVLCIPPVLFLLAGDPGKALVALGLIPLFLICWGLSILLAGKRLREIAKHMTAPERRQYNGMATAHGVPLGVLGFPVGVIAFMMAQRMGPEGYVYCLIPYAVFTLISIPFGLRHRREMARFALSTDYAKEKGWDSER